MALSAALALVTVWASIVASFASNWPIGFFVGSLAVVWYISGRLVAVARLRSARLGGRRRQDLLQPMSGRVAV